MNVDVYVYLAQRFSGFLFHAPLWKKTVKTLRNTDLAFCYFKVKTFNGFPGNILGFRFKCWILVSRKNKTIKHSYLIQKNNEAYSYLIESCFN